MTLDFSEPILAENIGETPNILVFYDTSAELFYIKEGLLLGKPTSKTKGNWSDLEFEMDRQVSSSDGIESIFMSQLNGFGAFGAYSTGNSQNMLLYEFEYEFDTYLENGSVTSSIDSAVDQFTLTLANPVENIYMDRLTNVAISESDALIAPGAKIQFLFSMGDSEPFELGIFYVDRSTFSALGESVSIDGRNLIGKILNDQTIDENHVLNFNYLHLIIEQLLKNANLSPDQYLIELSEIQNSFMFSPDTTFMGALEEILKLTITYKVKEIQQGVIVIGSPDYAPFYEDGIYQFHRGKDIFSRTITRDDQEAYRRVCVHDSEFSMAIYRDVENYTGWNLNAHKTLYVNVPDGTRQTEAEAYATELALRLKNVGKVESYEGPFRPYITPGDHAKIITSNGAEDIGIITDITHNFGKSGYVTSFTVDSGGMLGKGRLSDYISKITEAKSSSGSVGYE